MSYSSAKRRLLLGWERRWSACGAAVSGASSLAAVAAPLVALAYLALARDGGSGAAASAPPWSADAYYMTSAALYLLFR